MSIASVICLTLLGISPDVSKCGIGAFVARAGLASRQCRGRPLPAAAGRTGSTGNAASRPAFPAPGADEAEAVPSASHAEAGERGVHSGSLTELAALGSCKANSRCSTYWFHVKDFGSSIFGRTCATSVQIDYTILIT